MQTCAYISSFNTTSVLTLVNIIASLLLSAPCYRVFKFSTPEIFAGYTGFLHVRFGAKLDEPVFIAQLVGDFLRGTIHSILRLDFGAKADEAVSIGR